MRNKIKIFNKITLMRAALLFVAFACLYAWLMYFQTNLYVFAESPVRFPVDPETQIPRIIINNSTPTVIFTYLLITGIATGYALAYIFVAARVAYGKGKAFLIADVIINGIALASFATMLVSWGEVLLAVSLPFTLATLTGVAYEIVGFKTLIDIKKTSEFATASEKPFDPLIATLGAVGFWLGVTSTLMFAYTVCYYLVGVNYGDLSGNELRFGVTFAAFSAAFAEFVLLAVLAKVRSDKVTTVRIAGAVLTVICVAVTVFCVVSASVAPAFSVVASVGQLIILFTAVSKLIRSKMARAEKRALA